ncbi:hypothetical protein BKA61DRAFT_665847 [Leptodontidium sp. MPI-SDFR-AT-0119]|nr:hypothetical protein BKA61DRAFT_665847 [Leptodontidium sp. MPI-SDFR-AT-0119]
MVHINSKSVFGKVNLDDASSIRRVMIAMDYTLSDSVINFLAEEIQNLQGEERNTTSVLQTTIRGQQLQGNDLLLRATLRFIEARNGSDEIILEAAREFEELAEFDVFKLRVVCGKEYTAAEFKFGENAAQDTYLRGHETLFQRAPGAFGNQGETSLVAPRLEEYRRQLNPACRGGECKYPTRGAISKPDESKGDDAPPKDTSKKPGHQGAGKISRPSFWLSQNSKGQKRSVPERKDDLDGDPVRPPKRQSFTIVFKKPVEDLDETESEPESEYEPEPEPRAIPPPVRKQRKQKQDPKKTRGLRTDPKEKSVAESNEDDEEDQSRISQGYADTPANRPVRLPGRRIIDNGEYDRKQAVAGEMDPTKMVLTFSIEKTDPVTAKSIPDGKASFRYRHTVKWDNPESVQKLQRWRAQNFSRHLGPIRPARLMWLESERDILFTVLQDHLANVGGRWSRISWQKVADAYNSLVVGMEQKAGEKAAERLYSFAITEKGKKKVVTNLSTGQRLTDDRLAPARSAVGIRNQIRAFTHDTAKRIIDQAKDVDQKARAKKRKGENASPEPDSPANSDHDEEYKENGDATECGEQQEYSTMDTLLDDEGNTLPEQDYIDDILDEEIDADEPPPSRNEGMPMILMSDWQLRLPLLKRSISPVLGREQRTWQARDGLKADNVPPAVVFGVYTSG